MEMAALVGYYLAHAAPKEERLEAFGTKELEKYFIQGGYPVPSTPRLVLFNAKKAGYLDVKSHGKYKINAVGFNLIEHSLPGKGVHGHGRQVGNIPAVREGRTPETQMTQFWNGAICGSELSCSSRTSRASRP